MGKKSKSRGGSASEDPEEDPPLETTEAEYKDLVDQVAELSLEEAQMEWMEGCRYGELDVARALLGKFPDLVNYVDEISGNTGLHMAAANGHVAVVKLLVLHKHGFAKNEAGNTPLHWAASNGQSEVVDFLTHHKALGVDVLEKNEFGRSALTEGFSSQCQGVVKSLLEHDSATEEKLLSTGTQSSAEVTHKLFCKEKPLEIRELAMANADNPFADTDRPDQDTTGFSIWSASLVCARWMNSKCCWKGKSVLELGSGCGVPGLTIAASQNAPPRQVFVTDLNPKTVENLVYNIELNKLQNNTKATRMDWDDKTTWPEERVDFVVGADLIYQKSLVPMLAKVVRGMLQPEGSFFYVAPDTGRDGLEDFIEEMKKESSSYIQHTAPSEYHSNPLANEDDEECFLHFQELSSLTFLLHEFSFQEEQGL